MDIDGLAREFVGLANRQDLSKADHGEARRLMQQMKEAGMSNEEISKLSGRRWSPSSVKGYVTGIRATDPSPWGDAVSTLNEAINRSISLDDVQRAVKIQDQLASQGVTMEEVATLLAAAKSVGVGVESLIHQHQDLEADKLSLKDVGQALDLKRELEASGLSLQSLPDVVKLAKNFGGVQVVLDAVSKYGTISELNEEWAKTDKRLKSVKNELASETGCLDEAKANLIKLKQPLDAYGNVVKLGFSEPEFRELSGLTKKHGGVRRVFEAIKAYGELSDILGEISRAGTTLAEIRTEIAKTQEQHAHLKTATSMCDTLIHEYKFGLDAIATIFSVAKKYGEPINVLKAVEEYGKVLTIQQDLSKLEARVAELKKLLGELGGKYQEMLCHLESLGSQALKTGQDIGRLQLEVKQSQGLERIMNLINDPTGASYEDYGPLVLALAASLRKFILAHEQRFKSAWSIKSGLDSLIGDLGGK